MNGVVSTSVVNELRDNIEELDLEWVFEIMTGGDLEKGVPREILIRALCRLMDTSQVEDRYGHIDWEKYGKEVFRSIDHFLEEYIKYGVLKEDDCGRIQIALVESNLVSLEREGIKIEFNHTLHQTVYQRRMNTSGSIAFKPNGEYAVEGESISDPLSW